jgi:hypothetical protein
VTPCCVSCEEIKGFLPQNSASASLVEERCPDKRFPRLNIFVEINILISPACSHNATSFVKECILSQDASLPAQEAESIFTRAGNNWTSAIEEAKETECSEWGQ